jgi:hypothetical protein
MGHITDEGLFCYIPDSSWTPLRLEPFLEPIHTSGHIMFHALSDTPCVGAHGGGI